MGAGSILVFALENRAPPCVVIWVITSVSLPGGTGGRGSDENVVRAWYHHRWKTKLYFDTLRASREDGMLLSV